MNIAVLTDFSNEAYNALHYATQLYRDKTATFFLVHQYDRFSPLKCDYEGPNQKASLMHYLRKTALDCLEATKHRIILDTDNNKNHQFKLAAFDADLVGGTKNYIKQKNIDLLVMGNKGQTSSNEIFFGGNTMAVIKSQLGCPLLCIPKQMEFKPIRNLGYTTDFRHPVDEDALQRAKELAQISKAQMHIVHVSEEDELEPFQWKNKVYLQEFFAGIPINTHTLSYKKSKAETIAHFVGKNAIDLLVLNQYPHSVLSKIVREPVVLDLGIYLNIPFLIVFPQD